MKALSTGKKYDEGFSTLEILISFAVLILCMSAVVMLVFSGQFTTIDSEINNEAISKAQALIEKARVDSKDDFDLVNSSVTTETSGPITFTKKLDVSQYDFFTKKVTSTVSFQSAGRDLSTVFTTLITNPNMNGGGTCSSVLSGDWKNPQITTYEFGKDLIGDSSSGFPITAVDIYKGNLFVSVNNSNGNNEPTFFKFSLSDPLLPVLVSSVDNDSTVKSGINDLIVTDSYAYVASAKQSNFLTCAMDTCGQLQIIDISSSTPLVIKTFKIPGVTGTSGKSIGESIFYKNNYVYLGLAKTLTGPEFNIIDVSDPSNPVYKGGYHVGNGINDIFVKGDYAYIASPNSENITILDISDPENPTRVGGYSPAGGSNGKSVAVVGDKVYLGRTYGTNEFYVLDVADPSGVLALSSKDIGTGNNTTINSLSVRDYLVFMITDEKFEVWNISDLNNIYPWTQNQTASEFESLPGGEGTAMDCEGNYIYTGSLPSSDKGFISIITSS